jgi:hypothetical protein
MGCGMFRIHVPDAKKTETWTVPQLEMLSADAVGKGSQSASIPLQRHGKSQMKFGVSL